MKNITSQDDRKPAIVAAFKALVPGCRKVTNLKESRGAFVARCLSYGPVPGRGRLGYVTIGERRIRLKDSHVSAIHAREITPTWCPDCFEVIS